MSMSLPKNIWLILMTSSFAVTLANMTASAQQQQKPNILFIVSDDTGYGDLGPYGGGEGRGMPTPTLTAWRAKA